MCVWYCRSCLSAAQWSCVNESGLCWGGACRWYAVRLGCCRYAGESLLLLPSRSLRVWGGGLARGGLSADVGSPRRWSARGTRPVCSRLRRFARKAACPPALATSRCASVTMKNQCVAVRCPSPLEPNREDGGCVAGPFGPLTDLSWSPPLRIGPLGRGLTTSCQQPWESCATVPTLASDRGTSGGRSSYAAAKSPACVSYQSCMSWSSPVVAVVAGVPAFPRRRLLRRSGVWGRSFWGRHVCCRGIVCGTAGWVRWLVMGSRVCGMRLVCAVLGGGCRCCCRCGWWSEGPDGGVDLASP